MSETNEVQRLVSCKHSIIRGKEGEKGSWCIACGKKAYEVETRQCGDCIHSKDVGMNKILTCKKKLMGVLPDMNVTYKTSEGSCWGGS
jgi:ribosomal protein L37E